MAHSRKSKSERIDELRAGAIALVQQHGAESLTAESLAEFCEVSPQLVYAYFGNLIEVKRQALYEVFTANRAALYRRIEAATNLRELVAAFVRSDIEERESGSVIAQLEPLPGVGSVIADLRDEDRRTFEPLLFRAVRAETDLSAADIELVMNASSAASLAVARLLSGRDQDQVVDVDAAIEATVTYIMAGVAAVEAASLRI